MSTTTTKDTADAPTGGEPGTVVVLVHGAWHSSLHWAATQRALARRGLPSLAVDLPGHGPHAAAPTGYLTPGQPGFATERSAVADVTMDQLSGSLLETLAGLRPTYDRVVLLAHSAGGGPASAAVEREPELVDQIVYLSAFVPAGRPRFVDYVDAPENADAVQAPWAADPETVGAFRLNPLSGDPDEVAAIHRSFLHDWPIGRPMWRTLLHPDEPTASLLAPVTVSPHRWGRVPRTFVRLLDDRALPVPVQDLMIAEADRFAPWRPTGIRSLPGSHSPFLTRPDDLAETIASLAAVPR